MKFNQDQIVFIHIPRTAGSYIEKQLCEKYQCKQNWPQENTEPTCKEKHQASAFFRKSS